MQFKTGGVRKALTLVTTLALALGGSIGISDAAHASDAGKVFLSFETNDSLGTAAAGQAFSGASAQLIDSTHLTGKSMEFTKTGDAWSGANLLLSTSTSFHYTDSTHSTVTMDYWSNDTVASPVMLKLETSWHSYEGGPWVAKVVEAQPGLNHLSFDMTAGSYGNGGSISNDWTVMAIFPNFKADDSTYSGADVISNTGQKYEFDNISVNGGTIADVAAPPAGYTAPATVLTFESDDTLGAAAAGQTFSGSSAAIADAVSGGNGGKALSFTKAGDAWSGINIVLALADSKQILDGTHKTVTLNYYSPDSVNTPVQLNLVPVSGATIAQAVEAKPGWQTLTFDFTASYNADAHYVTAALFPDFVNTGDVPGYSGGAAIAGASQVYQIDNFAFNGGTTPAIVPPKAATSTLLTFETGDALGALINGAASGQKPQGGFEGAATSIAAAPAGGNGGNALKIVKATGGQVYAGVNMLIGTDFRISDGTHKVITFNYYSPIDNSPVRLELTPWPVALGMNVTAHKGWQTLTFDLSTMTGNNGVVWSADTEYTSLALFPDFNKAADNGVYYVDNFAMNGATTPAIPVAVAPAVTKAAAITGTAKVGKTLTVSATFSGTPAAAKTYKWYRCTVSSTKTATTAPTSAMKCSVISGQTSASHKVVTADVGKYLRAMVTGTNSAGSKISLTKTTVKATK